MSIATKTGDRGETALMYGRRVPKTHPRVEAYGCVDEFNAALGVVRVHAAEAYSKGLILDLQKELILVMGELATAPEDRERYKRDGYEVTTAAMVDRLTRVIDELEKEKLQPDKGWAIPGETLLSASLDVARTVCRRAERRVASLAETELDFNPEILRYLNRLSDLCWLLGRYSEQSRDKP